VVVRGFWVHKNARLANNAAYKRCLIAFPVYEICGALCNNFSWLMWRHPLMECLKCVCLSEC